MRFIILSLVLGFAHLPSSEAALFQLKPDSKIEMRVLSATWCGPCQRMLNNLLGDGTFHEGGAIQNYYDGQIPLSTAGVPYTLAIEQLESVNHGAALIADMIQLSEAAKLNPTVPSEIEGFEFIPFTMLYVDHVLVYSGFTGTNWGTNSAEIKDGLSAWLTLVTSPNYSGTGYDPESEIREPATK